MSMVSTTDAPSRKGAGLRAPAPLRRLGAVGRRVWTAGGPVAEGLAGHLAAVARGVRAGREEIRRLEAWAAEARHAAASIRGANAGRVSAVLAAGPLVSAEDVTSGARISRMTAERMLNRMTEMGLIREITGAGRFRLWQAKPISGRAGRYRFCGWTGSARAGEASQMTNIRNLGAT